MDDATSSENKYLSSKNKTFRFYDDFESYGSPPSVDGGGFVYFNYKVSQKPRVSTFDRINKELATAIEEKNGSGTVTPVTPSTPAVETPSTPSSSGLSLSVTDQGLVLQSQSELSQVPEISLQPAPTKEVSPLLILPIRLKGNAPTEELKKAENDETGKVTVASETLKPKISPQRNLGLGLTEKLQMLSKPPETPFVTPNTTPFNTPLATPLTTPQSSPKLQRKIMTDQPVGAGVLAEKSKSSVNSYFYRGNFFGASTVPNSATETISESTASVADNTKRLQESGVSSLGADAIATTRKRRPKPSNLREMNFWAPTSM